MGRQYRGIVITAVVVVIVWLADVAQLFQIPDGWLYDQLVRLEGWEPSDYPPVLLVEVDPEASALSSRDWRSLLEMLEEFGAEQVVFSFLPASADAAFYAKAVAMGNVVFGRRARPSLGTGEPALEDWGMPIEGGKPTFGAVQLPPAVFGIHRRAQKSIRVEHGKAITLTTAAAVQRGAMPIDFKEDEFLVNFNHGWDWLPRVSMERVLGGGLIAELVRGRSIVVGWENAPGMPGLHTPLTSARHVMSLLEFHGYALATLLNNRPIHAVHWAVILGMLTIVALASLMAYQWVNLVTGGWITIGLVASYLGAAWLMLHTLLVWIPIVQLILAQGLLFWLFVRFKLLKDEQEMRRVLLDRAARLRKSMLPPSFYSLDEHWSQVITLVDQTLNLTRSIFLEKIAGDHRVREVKALRCSLDDIDERRRDYERTPYSTAIAEGRPIHIEGRNYLKVPANIISEDQYLVPLLFGGEVQGFWAFGVDPAVVQASDRFLPNVHDFGMQVAELLYHRHRWQAQRAAKDGLIRRFLHLEAGMRTYQQVEETLGLLDRRLTALEAVFNGVGTATMLYDLFGRVVQLNRSMELYLQRAQLPGYEMTALDLLVAISGMDKEEARVLIQQVVIDRSEFQIPISRSGMEGENFSAHIRPLGASDVEAAGPRGAAPFQLMGILFEFVDVSGLTDTLHNREQLLHDLQGRLRKDLEGILRAGHGLENQKQPAQASLVHSERAEKVVGLEETFYTQAPEITEYNSQSISLIEDKVKGLLATLGQIQSILAPDPRREDATAYPVDARAELDRVIAELSKQASVRGVQFTLGGSEGTVLVRADVGQLRKLFGAICAALLSDAAADTEITVEADENNGGITYRFRNAGFGIPDEHLQRYLWDPDQIAADEFRDLREAVRPISDWNGSLELHSDIGVGFWSTLRLEVMT